MKPISPLLLIALIATAFLCGLFYQQTKTSPTQQKITLEQILSIRELHLVKHTYHDLFFLHRQNDSQKPIRAMVQIPVTITAYLNLKDIQLVHEGDSIKEVILPFAILDDPVYRVSDMTIRKTRGFQLHAGKDLYPTVGSYLGSAIRARMDTARHMAIANRILLQAEAEGKAYIESILYELGHENVKVTFNDERKDKTVAAYTLTTSKDRYVRPVHSKPSIEEVVLGFLPISD